MKYRGGGYDCPLYEDDSFALLACVGLPSITKSTFWSFSFMEHVEDENKQFMAQSATVIHANFRIVCLIDTSSSYAKLFLKSTFLNFRFYPASILISVRYLSDMPFISVRYRKRSRAVVVLPIGW